VEPALKAFCVMLWTGLVLAVIGVIALFIGIIDDGYSRSIAPYVIGCGAIGLAAPFLSAAGVIAGLGRREEASSTSR